MNLVELLKLTDVNHHTVLTALRDFLDIGEFDDAIITLEDASAVRCIALDVRHVLLLTVNRLSFWGDETDTVGIFSKTGLPFVLYGTSNASGVWDFIFLQQGADLGAEILSFLMDSLGWRMPQLRDTTLTNSRPDLLSREWVDQFVRSIVARVDFGEDLDVVAFMSKCYFE
jgi:hypothetical protein